MPIAPIVGVAFALIAGIMALAAKRNDPARPPKGALADGGVGEWDAEAIRIAACAMWTNGIWVPAQMAEGIANAVYPQRAWPPPKNAPPRVRKLWLDLIAYSKNVVAAPDKYCT